jgi:hypothetical protein
MHHSVDRMHDEISEVLFFHHQIFAETARTRISRTRTDCIRVRNQDS